MLSKKKQSLRKRATRCAWNYQVTKANKSLKNQTKDHHNSKYSLNRTKEDINSVN